MWICNQCHAENKDGYSSCDQCGANRSAGRFGSAPTALNTRPAPAPAPGYQQPLHRYAEAAAAQEKRMAPPPAQYMQGLGKTVGWALMILLPVLTALLAWRQYDVLSGALVPLLLEEGAGEVWKLVCYIGLGLVAVLVSMLPGLNTLLRCRKSPRKKKKNAK